MPTQPDDPSQLLQEWYDWWLSDDGAPVKLPKSLHTRTAVFLALKKYAAAQPGSPHFLPGTGLPGPQPS